MSVPSKLPLRIAAQIAEDALLYLPQRKAVEYRRGDTVLDRHTEPAGLYLISRGKVKVVQGLEDGSKVIIGIYQDDDFFGETGILGVSAGARSASALEKSDIMSWSGSEIKELIERQPRLGLALVQIFAQRLLQITSRLESLALEKTPERVARTLLEFTDRIGAREEDGSVRIPALTHQLISEYACTSREIVTYQMNQLRRLGYVQYSRKYIDVKTDALRERRSNGATSANGKDHQILGAGRQA